MSSPCPNKDVCGSCGWSHIPYEKQLEQKKSDINGSFAIKKLSIPKLTEIVASPKTDHYRNRMDFVINFEGKIGLREKGKWWRVIDDHTCFIADEQIDALYKTTRELIQASGLTYFDRKAHTGLLRYAVIRSTTVGETMIILVTSAPKDETEKEQFLHVAKNLAEKTNVTSLIWSINHTITDVSFGSELHTVSGKDFIEEEISGNRYRITPNAFFQTNPHGAKILLETVKEFAGDLSGKTLLDLYCGSGFFSIALAPFAQKTTGIELVPEAIADAKTNAELNNVQIDYIDAKTEEYNWRSLNPDVVILDPPRSGMHDSALKDVLEQKPAEIIYISCNYKHFAREMVELEKIYTVTHMRAIDMFPHTPHVELVTKLARKA